MADYGNPWASIPQALQSVTTNNLGLIKSMEDSEIAQQQKQLNTININKAQMDLTEAQEKQKQLNSSWDATTDPLLVMLPPEKQTQYLDSLKKTGIVNQMGIGTQRGRQMVVDRFKSDFGLASDYANVRLEQSRQKVAEAYNAFQKAQQSGDEQKIAQAREVYKGAVEENNAFAGKVDLGLKKVQTNQFFRENKDLINNLVAANPAFGILVREAQATDDTSKLREALTKVVETQMKPPERPYKIGQEITRDVGRNKVTYQVTGYDQAGMPVLRPIAVSEKDKPPTESPRQMGKDAAGLRKEFNNLQEIKDYNNIKTKYNAMVAALGESQTSGNLVAADQALITLFNKMTDPQSVVRESEYARTGVNMPFINMLKGKAKKVMSGGAGLTPEERTAIVRMGKLFMGTYQSNYNNRIQEYKGYAMQSGIDPDMVIAPEKPSGKASNYQIGGTYNNQRITDVYRENGVAKKLKLANGKEVTL